MVTSSSHVQVKGEVVLLMCSSSLTQRLLISLFRLIDFVCRVVRVCRRPAKKGSPKDAGKEGGSQ